MSYKPSENDLMAYLYGELEGAELEAMEKYLFQHPEARAEMERLYQIRKMLNQVKDKEVIAPPIFVGDTRHRVLWNAPYLKTIISIAASLLIVILVGRFSGMRIQYQQHEVRISFGGDTPANPATTPTSNPAASLSPDDVQAMINASLDNNNETMQSSWKETQEQLDASINRSLALNSSKIDRLLREASVASQDQIRQYVSGMQTENLQLVKSYFKLSSDEQKEYIESLLVDFSKYLQQQRNDDLQLVQSRLNSLEKNTNVFKQETEQILSSIITTVENKNPIGTTN
ncbi:hypothetical protein [Chryseolinea sp. H1M3-3]|uniref:anti-sigma factor family protein n=1 Tax=Chryseolinea sp. H1M3-3 TaxID=3034144 RepID=UPI0023ECABC9|nr:hypothetical protein [Chryseolinea sp. H1M3-3]